MILNHSISRLKDDALKFMTAKRKIVELLYRSRYCNLSDFGACKGGISYLLNAARKRNTFNRGFRKCIVAYKFQRRALLKLNGFQAWVISSRTLDIDNLLNIFAENQMLKPCVAIKNTATALHGISRQIRMRTVRRIIALDSLCVKIECFRFAVVIPNAVFIFARGGYICRLVRE